MHEDVIKVNFDTLVQEQHKYLVHVLLEAWQSICKSESHNFHLIWPEQCHEHGLPLVPRLDLDLVIPRLQIELSEEFQSMKLIHHFVNARQWVTILNGDLI